MSNQIDPVAAKVVAFNSVNTAIAALSQLFWATGGVEHGGFETDLEPLHAKRDELRKELQELPVKFSEDNRVAFVIV